jgi:hypothetical protein
VWNDRVPDPRPHPARRGSGLLLLPFARGRGTPCGNALWVPWVFLCACREVFKAKHRQTGQKVALKKVLMENEKEGVSIWTTGPTFF